MSNNYTFAFSKKSDHWASPKWIYTQFVDMFDPTPFHSSFDGLAIPWHDFNYCNPPYSGCAAFVKKAIEELGHGRSIVFLLPARFETRWMQNLYDHNAKFVLFRSRLHFNESKQGAPFPSVMVFLVPKARCVEFEYYDGGLSLSLRSRFGLWWQRWNE